MSKILKPLNNVYIYSGNKNIKKQYFVTYVAFSSSINIEFFLHKSWIYKSHLVKKETFKLFTTE